MKIRGGVVALAAAAAVATGGVLPAVSNAQAECPQVIFQFSRAGANTPAGNIGGPGLNPGTFGCLVGRGPDVRYFNAGATQTSAATYAVPIDYVDVNGNGEVDAGDTGSMRIELLDFDEQTGEYTVIGEPIDLVATHTGTRFATGYIDLGTADAARSSAEFAVKPGHRFSTIYRHLHVDPEGER